ncbi:inositol phospholipid synthesis and fat-storage-inducing TM-domain-containing protein [Nemania sp. FL0916]|nr:inositol phospholipid synthesis and fat-storage-inducing TM-domain-containing protein [Nemania sp. FL0916]
MAEDHGSLRSRGARMSGSGVDSDRSFGAPPIASSRPTTTTTTAPRPTRRSSPFLPTPLESAILAIYPAVLVFGALFAVLSPETRGAPYDAIRQAHVQAHAPSYFARKDNLFNVLFVKRGWLWITVAFAAFVGTHPALRSIPSSNGNDNVAGNSVGSGSGGRRLPRAAVRWVLVTAWWFLVTQWCFGAPLIDRGFRFTGGRCDVALGAVVAGVADREDLLTAAACRAAGGNWSGGHDISGHVFLLVLGSCFLVQEVGWVILSAASHAKITGGWGDDRAVVMHDDAVKGAAVESERMPAPHERHLGLGGKFALGIVGLSLWMLLMTAVYFHTWFEKFTGLLVASMGIYAVYILPRWIPSLRAIVGLPGI